MPDESVKVAVRVRPFNQREKDRHAKCIIKMSDKMTTIQNPDTPNDDPKQFSFDYSYWSHDEFTESSDGVLHENPGSQYATQRMVYNDLGQGVLDNAFQGYNCSLFAYGQTGSGKSFSMVGYGPNRGIVPITCDELFKAMNENKDANRRFEVTFSMLEIYNEQVKDLLSKDNPRGGLHVRQNPQLGMFYVEALKHVPVGSYKEIAKRMDQGTASRTVASTNMNATSSRAHTVVTITFDQIIKNETGQETKKSSIMNLIDLAGSERADSTGATGDRLKEGANINRSLSALGNVISALADLSMGKKKIMVPYRDSVLTKLLQNALGGNSKTIMIAALSPADINFDETLSTLRYADRAKKIKNKAVVNESPIEKLIRELREENERLKRAMEGGGIPAQSTQGLSPAEIEQMRAQMEEQIRAQLQANQELLHNSAETWEDKLAAAQTETAAVGEQDVGRRQKEVHLVNLNEDPMLSGVIFHYLATSKTTIGRKDGDPVPTICLNGLSIQKQHAVLYNNKGQVEIEPLDPGSKIKVNGLPLDNKKSLKHKDRILFGSNHLYVFINPVKKDASADLPKDISWEFAQKEIAQAKGFATGSGDGLSKDQQIAQEQILELLPMVSEANAVSEELDKHKSFEVVLISAAAQEGGHGSEKGTKVMVKMKNLLNGNTWLWERGKFMNRRYLIQEMYQKYLDGDDSFQVPQDQDPFWEPSEDVLIGTANVFLDSLSYALDFDDSLSVTDYKGLEEGSLDINITPCKKAGRPLDESDYVEDPSELLGKPYHFKVTVKSAEVNKIRFSKGTMVKYKVYTDREYTKTKMVSDTLAPDFNHSAVFGFPSVNQELLEFFSSGCITFLLYGMQVDIMPDSKMLKLTTRELRQMENMNGVGLQRRKSLAFSKDDSSDHSHLKTEMVLLQRKHDRLVQKEARIQQLCEEWSHKPHNEQEFDAFLRAVSAAAYSTGTKLRTHAKILTHILRGHSYIRDKQTSQPYDIVSIYVFGEEEAELVADAQNNNGIVSMEKLTQYSYCNSTPLSREKTQLWDHESMSSVDLNPYLRPDTAYDDDYAYQEVHAKPVKVYAKNYDRHSSLDSRGPSRRRSRRNRNRHKQGGNNQKQNGNRSNSSRGLVKSDSGEQRDGSATCVLQ